MNWLSQRIAFVGTGQMATALAAGFVRELLMPEQISGYDPIEAYAGWLLRQRPVKVCGCLIRPQMPSKGASIVILAVKPQVMNDAIKPLAESIKLNDKSTPLVVSIAAGVPIARLEQALPSGTRVIRVMPTHAVSDRSRSFWFGDGSAATADDAKLISELLATVVLSKWSVSHFWMQ